jgi:hypothetical protein
MKFTQCDILFVEEQQPMHCMQDQEHADLSTFQIPQNNFWKTEQCCFLVTLAPVKNINLSIKIGGGHTTKCGKQETSKHNSFKLQEEALRYSKWERDSRSRGRVPS